MNERVRKGNTEVARPDLSRAASHAIDIGLTMRDFWTESCFSQHLAGEKRQQSRPTR